MESNSIFVGILKAAKRDCKVKNEQNLHNFKMSVIFSKEKCILDKLDESQRRVLNL